MATSITDRLGASVSSPDVTDLSVIEGLTATGVPERTGANTWVLRPITGANDALAPATADALSLGTGALPWSDLYLAAGSTMNWDNGNVTLAHAANTLMVAGGALILPNAGLHLLDAGGDHNYTIRPAEDATADRTLNLDLSDADRTLAMSGDFTVGGALAIIPSRTDLKVLSPSIGDRVTLTEAGRAGLFIFDSADLSSEVTADTQEGVTVPPNSDTSGTSGAWVRSFVGPVQATWFGLSESAAALDNTTALNAAITYMNTNRGVLELPEGEFDVNGLNAITGNGITIRGQGQYQGTTLSMQATASDLIAVDGQHCVVENLHLAAGDVLMTAGFAVKFNDTFQCAVRDVRIEYFWSGVYAVDGSAVDLDRIILRHLIGDKGILFEGTNGNGLFSARAQRIDGDNPYPNDYGTVKTWATSTAFALNDIIKVNGKIYQCVVAGTSAGAGSGPSGYGGSTGATAFTANIADGTAEWRFVAHESLFWVIQDNYAYSCSVDNSSLINGSKGVVMRDTAASGSSYPTWFNCHSLEIDHPFDNGVHLERGEGFYMTQGWIGSSLQQRGLMIDSNYRGEAHIGGGTRIVGHWSDGILLQNGPEHIQVVGSYIALNSQNGSGNNHGIAVAAGASHFIIANNEIGHVATGSGQQGYGVIVNAGGSDFYNIANNIVQGNATGGVNDGGTGTNKTISGNV